MASHGEGYRKPKSSEPVFETNGPHIAEEVDPAEEWQYRSESAKDTFESIFKKIISLKGQGDREALQQYLVELHEEYFASSNDLFSELSLKDNFEMLMRINKIDEMQGPVGQAGVNQLVYRLANFQYGEGNKSNEEIAGFIGTLLKDKNISDTVEVLAQLQTVAAQGLANGSWAEPVYEGILKYLKTPVLHEVFILSKVKERLSQRLSTEEDNPTMGVVTTLDNKHQGLMFENEVFDEELDSKVNNAFSFGSASKVRVSTLSRDYSGIFDTRNRLVSLVPAKSLDLSQANIPERTPGQPSMDDYYDSARFLNDRNHLFNKALYLFSKGVLDPSQKSSLINQFAELVGISAEELTEYVENEKQYNALEKEGGEVDKEIIAKSDRLFALLRQSGLDFGKFKNMEDSLYKAFGEQYAERANKRQPVETLDLTKDENLGFLGLTGDNIELFKVLQDPYFTKTIQETVGIKLSDLDMRAQTAFLNYLARATKSDVEEFSLLLKKFDAGDRVKICSAYLAFEDDESLGYIVENLCKRPEVALPIMTVVYDLIGNAGKIEDFLLSEFKTEDDREVITSVYSKIIAKAKDILLHYNAKAMNLDDMAEIAYGSEMMKDHADVLEEYGYLVDQSDDRMKSYQDAERELVEKTQHEISNMSVTQLLFLNSFKSLKESGKLDLEAIRGTSLEMESGADFASHEKDVAKVKVLLHGAYRKESSEFQTTVLHTFEKSLTNPDSRFYALRRDNELIAALRFDETKDEEGNVVGKYFGSFVSDPAYGNGKLGEAIFEKAIAVEATGDIPINAHCNPLSPIVQKYIETGFVATKLETYAGKPSFSITLDATINERSETKLWSIERVVRAALEQNTDTIKGFAASNVDSIPFELVNDGFKLTRFTKVEKRFYAIFERIPAESPAAEETKGVA